VPKVLVLFAHPAIRQSRVQRALLAAAREAQNVSVHDLYEAYPDFDIDVDAEQERLIAHDIIIFQHPLYWYSVPPMIKQWFDLVLEHGWAYGSKGKALAGKRAGVAISAGGGAEAYRADGFAGHTLQEFLLPVESTLRLCQMTWLPPFFATGTHSMEAPAIVTAANRYGRWLHALTNDRLNRTALSAQDADVAMQDL